MKPIKDNFFRNAVIAWLALGLIAGLATTVAMPKQEKHRERPLVVRPHNFILNQKAIQKAIGYTVLISNEGLGGVGRGTGVLLDSTHVLTCFHMLEDGNDDLWIFPYPARRALRGIPVYGDKGADLLVLKLDEPVVISNYAVFNSSFTLGQPITIIGNTIGMMQWFTSYGIVSGTKGIYILTDGLIRGGNSGGPWINDNGEILALTDWGLSDKHNNELGISGGVSAESIKVFLYAYTHPSLLQLLLQG